MICELDSPLTPVDNVLLESIIEILPKFYSSIGNMLISTTIFPFNFKAIENNQTAALLILNILH